MHRKAQPDGRPKRQSYLVLIASCGPKYTCTTASWSRHRRHLNVSV